MTTPLQQILDPAAPKLEPGLHVRLQLESGELVNATVVPDSEAPSRVTAKAKTWSRWAGAPEEIAGLAREAAAEIERRSSEKPPVDIRIALEGNDEERYTEIATFESEIQSADPGAPGARLRDVKSIYLAVGPSRAGALKATAAFGSGGAHLELEGADRAVVAGLKEELAPMIDAGRPKLPALPGPALMFFGGIVGFAYAYGLSRINWDFLPDGLLGVVLFALLYLCGFIAAIYAVIGGVRTALPPFTLTPRGQATQSQQLLRRAAKIGGSLAAALLPFVLEKILG